MSQPFIGHILQFAGNFQIRGYAYCNGQLISIDQNSALFSLIGTTYGGDGQTTFALPNLQSRVIVGQGTGAGLSTRTLGQVGGVESVTLATANLPAHTHQAIATTAVGTAGSPSTTTLMATPELPSAFLYIDPAATGTSDAVPAAGSVTNAGGNQPHNNIMPSLGTNYLIALEGVFPTRN